MSLQDRDWYREELQRKGGQQKSSPAGGSEFDRLISGAYSAEDDRLFRRNVTGDSAESALWAFSTRVGHDQSRFLDSSGHGRV
jgi:hypothetical protein